MKSFMKSVKVVGKVIGLLIGSNFTTPTLHVMEQYITLATFKPII